MTHVSKRKLDKSTEEFLNSLLSSTFSSLSKKDAVDILSTTFSKTELTMIKKRLAIILFLGLGFSSSKIAETLKTTAQTIERIRLHFSLMPKDQKKKLIKRLKQTFVKEGVADFSKNLDMSKKALLKKIDELWF